MDSTSVVNLRYLPLCLVDVDECLESRCAHRCENTVGSFRCTCDVGYRATLKGKCIDKDECAIGVPSCYDCVNTIGRYGLFIVLLFKYNRKVRFIHCLIVQIP